MQRILFHLPALVLAVWGTVLVHVVVTGRIAMLLAPVFRPFALIAGALLLALAVGHIVYFQPAPPPRPRKRAPAPQPPSLTFEASRWLVLLVHVVVAAALAPNGYSDKILLARGVQTTPVTGMDPSDEHLVDDIRMLLEDQPPGEPLELSLYDVIAMSVVPRAAEVLGDQPVELVGQYSPDPSGEESFRLVDIMVFCCAADAIPMGVNFTGQPPEDLEPMDWISVVGPLKFESHLGRVHVSLEATSVEPEPEPEDAFLPY